MLFVSLLLVLLAMEVAGGFVLTSLSRYYMQNFTQNLTTQGTLLGSFLARYLTTPDASLDLSPLIAQFGSTGGVRTVVVDRYGRVVGISGALDTQLGMKLSSPLVSSALRGQRMEVYSKSAGGQPDLVVALPVTDQGQTVGAVELTELLTPVNRTIAYVRQILIFATLLALLLSFLVGLAVSRMVSRPVRSLIARVRHMARGRFDAPPARWSEDEIGDLGRAFDNLSTRLHETMAAIADEKQKLETVLFHMREGLVAVDAEGRVVLSNPRSAALLRTAVETGMAIEELPLLRDTAPGRPLVTAWPDENGPFRTLRIESSPVADSGLSLFVIQDVTEETQLEAMRKQFVADVGHELRTPLTTIKSYLETVTSEKGLKPTLRRRFVSVALSETERLVRLVRDLLTLSQADDRRLGLDPRPVDVATAVEETLVRLGPAVDGKQIRVASRLDAALPPIWADPDRVGQVLLNVVGNAVEYSPRETEVTISARPEGQDVVIEVADNGPGIPDEDLPHIFERFHRVDKARSRAFGGTGLGLAIVREIVLAHGGDVEISSRTGEGTRLTVRFPAAKAPGGAAVAATREA